MTDRRPVAGSKQKDIGDPTSNLPAVDSTTPTPSSNVSNVTLVKEQRRGVMPVPRDLHDQFGGGQSSNKQQEPPTLVSETNDTFQNAVSASESANAAQDGTRESKCLAIISHSDDPNDQWKADAIKYSAQVIDILESLTDIIGSFAPDALGQALEKITTILEKLKVRSSFWLVVQSSATHSG